MNMDLMTVMLQAAAPAGGGSASFLIMMVLIFAAGNSNCCCRNQRFSGSSAMRFSNAVCNRCFISAAASFVNVTTIIRSAKTFSVGSDKI